jgi:hypothetical protein
LRARADPERDADGELVPNRGLLALPPPVTGDLFFDIEGARYYSEDGKEFGLQYLFGVIDTADVDATGAPRYTQIWAFDRRGEKLAFEELVDFITDRRACTSTTTTTTSRPPSITSPSCTAPGSRRSAGSWAGSPPARTGSTTGCR